MGCSLVARILFILLKYAVQVLYNSLVILFLSVILKVIFDDIFQGLAIHYCAFFYFTVRVKKQTPTYGVI